MTRTRVALKPVLLFLAGCAFLTAIVAVLVVPSGGPHPTSVQSAEPQSTSSEEDEPQPPAGETSRPIQYADPLGSRYRVTTQAADTGGRPVPVPETDIVLRGEDEYLEDDPAHLPAAHYALATAHLLGDSPGIARDPAAATQWFSRAAEGGHAAAQIYLGDLYIKGNDFPVNYVEARSWYELAAARAVTAAQLNLGVLYANGHGVPIDFEEAARWFRLAAEGGNVDSFINLGTLLLGGRGVPRDTDAALAWFRRGAEASAPRAVALLAELYFDGNGVE